MIQDSIIKLLRIRDKGLRIQSKSGGFTLIETLTALSIFSISIVALISVTSQGVASASYLKNKLAASYLAQEGIEIVRNTRDSYISAFTPNSDWNTLFGSDGTFSNCGSGCAFNVNTLTDALTTGTLLSKADIPSCIDNPSDCKIATSIFTRTITITDSLGQMKVESKVEWLQGVTPRSVIFTEYLSDWQ
ncbi:MAG: Type II secretory pathway protein LspI [Candidatus Nomurabacteria bacterium GW2011_GWB1_37_5]|uniref:Type II secretory pathway protein LspI n=1 Tax=Candidatus Nomurabacteria bacterium GW2011_GWB1_37_5 TaxID=1618742 RepID=A0A0G0GYD1_9BACT|nr:MAG: Type II secretory pathway protein LspI [Candidatus Nomurabacteria bacterium GW2011_GWB1_37_5]